MDASGSIVDTGSAPDGRGVLRGDDREVTEVGLYADDEYERPLRFYLVFDQLDRRTYGDFSGQWEIRDDFVGTAIRDGTFRATLTRAATERIVVP